MSSGADLAAIDAAAGWIIFDTLTAQAILMDKPKLSFDIDVAALILSDGELLAATLALIYTRYIAKGWIPI